jgi:hypothetical protein
MAQVNRVLKPTTLELDDNMHFDFCILAQRGVRG